MIPPSQQTIRLPVTTGALDVARGDREAFFEDAEADGTHMRVYTAPLERGEAIQIARSLEEVDDVLDELALDPRPRQHRRAGLGAGLGVLVSRAALSPVAASARPRARSPRPSTSAAGSTLAAAPSSAAWRRASTRC